MTPRYVCIFHARFTQMHLNRLTYLAFYLNGALGSGHYDRVTIADVKREIEHGTIFDYLDETLEWEVVLSLLSPDDREELVDEWRVMACRVNEFRKLCVESNGFCLLVAYLLEGIQRRTGDTPLIPDFSLIPDLSERMN